jgi:hypothetical protein
MNQLQILNYPCHLNAEDRSYSEVKGAEGQLCSDRPAHGSHAECFIDHPVPFGPPLHSKGCLFLSFFSFGKYYKHFLCNKSHESLTG